MRKRLQLHVLLARRSVQQRHPDGAGVRAGPGMRLVVVAGQVAGDDGDVVVLGELGGGREAGDAVVR